MKKMNIECVDLSLIDEGKSGFGILVKLPSGAVKVLHSVSTHRSEVIRICKTVNRLGVSECHVCDVIEDFLP